MESYPPTFASRTTGNIKLSVPLPLPVSQKDKTNFLSQLKIFPPPSNMYLRYDNHVVIDMRDMTAKYEMGTQLCQVLGFDDSVLIGPKVYISQRPLSLGSHQLFVYCNVVDYTMVGNEEKNLLYSVAFNDRSPVQSTYVPLKHEATKLMKVSIRNEKGELINFPTDSVTQLKLHFKPQ